MGLAGVAIVKWGQGSGGKRRPLPPHRRRLDWQAHYRTQRAGGASESQMLRQGIFVNDIIIAMPGEYRVGKQASTAVISTVPFRAYPMST